MDFWVILAFFAGIGATLCFFKLAERRALSIVRQKNSIKGNEAKRNEAEELLQFLAEVKTAYDTSKAAGEDIKTFATTHLAPIALKHPILIMRYGKKLMALVGGEGIADIGALESLMAA